MRPPYDKKRIWRSLSTLIVPSFWVKVRLSAVAKFGARQGPGEPLIGANVQPLAGSTKYKEQRMARTEMSPSSMDPALQMRCLCRTRIPSVHGTFSLFYYGVPGSKEFHLAVAHGAFVSQSLDVCVPGESIQDRLVRGATTPSPSSILESDGTSEISDTSSTLVRIHSSCLTSETFGSLRCDCAEQLSEALAQIAKEPRGLVVYLSQEGRGIGLLEKLKYVITLHTVWYLGHHVFKVLTT